MLPSQWGAEWWSGVRLTRRGAGVGAGAGAGMSAVVRERRARRRVGVYRDSILTYFCCLGGGKRKGRDGKSAIAIPR